MHYAKWYLGPSQYERSYLQSFLDMELPVESEVVTELESKESH